MGGAATEIHDGVGVEFDNAILLLRLVLMLMVGFRFMLGDEKGADNISNLLGNFIFSSISDEGCLGTMLVNVVRQS